MSRRRCSVEVFKKETPAVNNVRPGGLLLEEFGVHQPFFNLYSRHPAHSRNSVNNDTQLRVAIVQYVERQLQRERENLLNRVVKEKRFTIRRQAIQKPN